ncbi:MAG: hypothetical protein J7601_12590 [Chloroflexi bacterium]|nr:hypothetical protein [Chloroflexota bacterium]
MPLAIELAAARLSVLSLEQIAQRLSNRFNLLTSGNRLAPPKQQTLRTMIDWSCDLLSEPERILLRRLSIFTTDWTLDLAEAICSEEEPPSETGQADERADLRREDVLDVLTYLVSTSLVTVGHSRATACRIPSGNMRTKSWSRPASLIAFINAI